jgi:dUTP pyrophosphatase
MNQQIANQIEVKIQILPHGESQPIPTYATSGSAGLDLMAAIHEPLILAPLERALIPTGIAIALPEGFEAQIRPRSGLALKHGITCLNSPGTIDSDYRGEIKVLLINLGQEAFTIEPKMRISQMIIAEYAQAKFNICLSLEATERGSGGFGSTGTNLMQSA